ncbi:nucleoside diphosphate kinase regulator [Ramlibacter sp. AW1]|uniref:Nucleoside diphosphate kinase regulator n=1 Tax=Ramlibacter aurantiacus TaxID=2801330 RepID=A0A936ZJI5_9BURK|nr:nucleoside diphosphate kinase regulator [Ramlibacter aurantiacus]MBL0418906.1 nucleoside diphosphate kinase regulator [Ramlibacter aurantiacus]
MTASIATRTLTELDHARVSRLLSRPESRPPSADSMAEILDFSEVVPSPAVPPTVVTMNSQVRLKDARSGVESELTLSYPNEADAASGRVSVLSPMGFAVLGLSVGDLASWRGPTGEEGAAVIVSVLYQPEAAGDYLL